MGLFRRTPARPTVLSPLRVAAGRNALTASGYKVKTAEADLMRRLIQPWQARAFAYYDIVPEIKYASQFYSRALSVLRLYPGKKNAAGDVEELTDGGDPAVQAFERIQDPGGGRSGLLGAYGRLMFLIGEGYLLVSEDAETGLEQWEMLSPDELRITSSGMVRYRAPSLTADFYRAPDDDDFEPLGDTAVAYRLWRRHPRFSMLADSTMQGVLEVCEELIVLTQAVRARGRSRLAGSGILLVNGKIGLQGLDGTSADEDPMNDPLIADLTEAMTQPIVDEGAASAVVPLVVRCEVDNLDQAMKHIQIVDPTQLYPETGLRTECVRRLAIGLDMPPEILEGVGDANHWSAWSIDEQTWKAHLQPVSQQLVDDLTSAYYQPMLRQNGTKDWMDYVIAYDATAVINHPDRSKDAKDLYDRRAISKEALREAGGFDEDDAPSEDEWNEMVGVALRDGSLAVYGIPQIRGTGGLEPNAGDIEQGDKGTTTVDPSIAPNEATKEPPQPDGGGAGKDEPTSGNVVGSAKIIGASELALLRTREAAGNRLRSLAKKDAEARKLVEGVLARDVPRVLGRARAAALGAPPERVLVSGSDALLLDAFRMWGVSDGHAAKLVDVLLAHAARHLYDDRPPSLPPAFENFVRGIGA